MDAIVQQLVFLAPGTTNVTANYCAANCEGGVFPSEQYAKVNGGGANGVNYLLDGVDANDTYINANVPFPNPDALQEFNLITGNMSASFGNAIGGVVNVVTKSGTDQIHGDVFEFLRNSALDASDYFSGGAGQSAETESIRRQHRRPDHQEPLILFRKLPGNTAPHRAEWPDCLGSECDRTHRRFFGSASGDAVDKSDYRGELPNNQIPVSPVATYILNHIPLPNGPNDQLNFNGGPDAQNTDEYFGQELISTFGNII